MKRDYRDYLEDILAAIDESAEFTRDISFEVFTQDRKTVNAVVRSLEVLGEAARSIPDHLRASRCPLEIRGWDAQQAHPRVFRRGPEYSLDSHQDRIAAPAPEN